MIALLHPGDFSFYEWIWLFGYILVLIILPIGIAGFIIYKVVKN